MTDADGLLAAFDSGELLRPSPDVPNIVDLSNAIAGVSGLEDRDGTPGSKAIADLIGRPKHLVLVAADGLGMNTVRAMGCPQYSRPFQRHRRCVWVGGQRRHARIKGYRRLDRPPETLVAADGLGMNTVRAMGEDAFLPSRVATELRTVFPSSTRGLHLPCHGPVAGRTLGHRMVYVPE